MERIIPDTSAIIIGAISEIIENEELDFPEIIVPEAVVCELEHQANANRSEGHRGLSELQKLQKLQDEGKRHDADCAHCQEGCADGEAVSLP